MFQDQEKQQNTQWNTMWINLLSETFDLSSRLNWAKTLTPQKVVESIPRIFHKLTFFYVCRYNEYSQIFNIHLWNKLLGFINFVV